MAINNQNNGWDEFQQANNQLVNVQAQRQQNLAEEKAYGAAINGQNDVLAQGSGIMLDAVRPVQLNQPTQAILGKYGVQKPQTTRTVVGGNTTIINNTYNNNYSGGDYGGPVQGRALAFKQQEATVGKFKLWLDNLFARQKEESARRERDYEKRERNLQKESNRLGKKLEGLGSSIGKALDPRRADANSSNQLKQLLLMFGIGTLAKNFEAVLEKVDEIKGHIENTFGAGKDKSFKDSKIAKGIVEAFGGKENETILDAFGGFFKDLGKRVKDKLDVEFKVRADAIKAIPLPVSGGVNLSTTLVNVATYLGEVLSCAFSGTKGQIANASRGIVSTVSSSNSYQGAGGSYDALSDIKKGGFIDNNFKLLSGDLKKEASTGDFRARYSTAMSSTDLDARGNLKDNVVTSSIQGRTINSLVNDKETGQIHTMEIMSGQQRLKQAAQKHGAVAVSKDYLNSISTLTEEDDSAEDIANRIGLEGPLKFKYIISPKTDEEWEASKANWKGKWSVLRGAVGVVTGGAAAAVTAVGTANPAAAFGAGVAAGDLGEKAFDTSIENAANKRTRKNTVRLVPEDYELGEGEQWIYSKNGKQGFATEELYLLTPENIDKLEKEVLKFSFDVSNTGSVEKLERRLLDIKKEGFAKKYSGNEKKFQTAVNSIYSDTEDVNYANNFNRIRQAEQAEAERQEALDEINNREDHVSRSRFSRESISEGYSKLRGKVRGLTESFKNHYAQTNTKLGKVINKAIRYLDNNKESEYSEDKCGHCGRAIGSALQAAGIDVNIMHGYQYKDWAENNGYDLLGQWDNYSGFQKDTVNYKPDIGDLLVVGPKGEHKYGHVAMYTGNGKSGWSSDFDQGSIHGLTNPSEYGWFSLLRPTEKIPMKTGESLVEGEAAATSSSDWKPSDSIKKYIKSKEDFKGNWYTDGNGHRTIGYGFKETDELRKKYPNGMTQEEADKYFDKAVNDFVPEFVKNTPNFDKLNDSQKDALFSYFYNIGQGNYTTGSPEMQQALQDMNWDLVAANIDAGYNNTKLPGLRTRREEEQAMFRGSTYEGYQANTPTNYYAAARSTYTPYNVPSNYSTPTTNTENGTTAETKEITIMDALIELKNMQGQIAKSMVEIQLAIKENTQTQVSVGENTATVLAQASKDNSEKTSSYTMGPPYYGGQSNNTTNKA